VLVEREQCVLSEGQVRVSRKGTVRVIRGTSACYQKDQCVLVEREQCVLSEGPVRVSR